MQPYKKFIIAVAFAILLTIVVALVALLVPKEQQQKSSNPVGKTGELDVE